MRIFIVFIAIFLAAAVLSPPILHAALTPFARTCKPDFFRAPVRRAWNTIEYDHCEFGLPQPFEVVVSMLASDSPYPVSAAFTFLLGVGGMFYAIGRGLRRLM